MAYNVLLLSPPILACCIISIAAAAFILNPIRRRPAYVILLILGAAWNLNVALLFFLSDTHLATLVCKLTHACLLLLIATLYYALPAHETVWRKDNLFFLTTGLILSIFFILPIDTFISGVREVRYLGYVHHYYGIPGKYYYIFLLYFFSICSLLVYRLYFQTSSSYSRQLIHRQYLYTLTGLVALCGINDLLPYMGITTYPGTNLPVYPFGSAAALLWAAGLLYAGVRYGLFELDLSLRALSPFFLTFLLLGFILAFIVPLLQNNTNSIRPIYGVVIVTISLPLCFAYYWEKHGHKASRTIEQVLFSLDFISRRILADSRPRTNGYLDHCIMELLGTFSSLVPGNKALILCSKKNHISCTAYVSGGRYRSISRRSLNRDIAFLPFSDRPAQLQVVLGMDVCLSHRTLIEHYFPFIDDRYVWLRHTVNGVDLAISAFCFTSRKRILTEFERVALLLISNQASLALAKAISFDEEIACLEDNDSQASDHGLRLVPLFSPALSRATTFDGSRSDIVSGAIAHDLRSHVTLLGIELKRLRNASATGKIFSNVSWERIAGDLSLLSKLTMDLAEYSCASDLFRSPQRIFLSDLFSLLRQKCLGSIDKQVEITCNNPPHLRVPQRYMEIVLGNLMQNAVESIPLGGRGSITLTARISSGTLILEVSDNGIGLKAGELNQLFTPTLKPTPSDPKGITPRGTGLGLTIVKRLVDCAGGRIQAQSAYKNGTKITLVFHLESSQL